MDEESQLEALKRLSARAILEFEDVKAKYEEYYGKFCKEEEKVKKLDSQFKQLKQVSLLAVAEYESLQKQYVAENKYRVEVEEKLKKVSEENLEIQKQKNSVYLTSTLNESNSQANKGDFEVLRSLKDAVNDELRRVKKELALTKEELARERDEHKITRSNLNTSIQQINQLKRVSVMALDEFNSLKVKFDIEKKCREKAEDYAAETLYRTNTESKISRAMMISSEDKQIKKLTEEVEEIIASAEKERKEYTAQIKELQDELASSKSISDLKSLEDKVSLLMDQLEMSQKQLEETEARALKAEDEVRTLFGRLSSVEKELQGVSEVGSLPPPPPPPPPPLAAPIIKKFIFKIGKKKKTKGPDVDESELARVKAMEDMIERIKKGVKLRSVSSPLKTTVENGDENLTAMGELAGLLTNLRTNQREKKEEVKENEPEFTKLKLRKAPSVQQSGSVEESVSELKMILQKQKSFAEILDVDESQNKNNDNTESTEPTCQIKVEPEASVPEVEAVSLKANEEAKDNSE